MLIKTEKDKDKTPKWIGLSFEEWKFEKKAEEIIESQNIRSVKCVLSQNTFYKPDINRKISNRWISKKNNWKE